jgi:hypothetical protein
MPAPRNRSIKGVAVLGHLVRVAGATETAKIPALTKGLEGLYASSLSRSASNSELVVAGYPKILPDRYDKLGKVQGTPFCTFDHLVGVVDRDARA